MPTDEWLAEHRRQLNVPDGHEWGWCDMCEQIVWFDPAEREARVARGRRWILVCSQYCSDVWLILDSLRDARGC
jgi:hypothetical protein